jgi:FkbM family methyltransferase
MHWLLYIRPTWLRTRLKHFIGIQRQIAQTSDGLRFEVDPVSHFGNHILTNGCYEEELARLFRTVLRPGDAMLDIGANEGYFTVLAGSLTKGRVVAIEPQSRLREVILSNLRNNGLEAELHSVALGAESGKAMLSLCADSMSGGSSLVRSTAFGTEEVALRSLDGLAADHGWPRFRLVKIDCEGYEEPILQGAKGMLQSHGADFISVDYHATIVGPEPAFRIDRVLRDAGYTLSTAGGVWVYHLPGLEADLAKLGEVKPVGPDLVQAFAESC